MAITIQEKIRRKKAVEFVETNSLLEGLTYEHPAINALYQDYISGKITTEELVKLGNDVIDKEIGKLHNVS